MKATCLCALLLLFCLTGCAPEQSRQISCDDVITAYESAGYEVFHTAPEGEDYVCCIKAEDPASGQYILFHFFESAQAAEDHADAHRWNGILWLYALVNGEPFWLTTRSYGSIEYEYADSDLARPFQALIR